MHPANCIPAKINLPKFRMITFAKMLSAILRKQKMLELLFLNSDFILFPVTNIL